MKITLDFTPAEFQAILAESVTLRILTNTNINSPTGETNPDIALSQLQAIFAQDKPNMIQAIKYFRECSSACRRDMFAKYPKYTDNSHAYRLDGEQKRGLANSKYFMEYLRDEFLGRI